MKKPLLIISLILLLLTGCTNNDVAALPEEDYEIEVTHNQHSGMVSPGNPYEKPELDPNFINSFIDEEEKERKEDYVEQNMTSVIISSNNAMGSSSQAYQSNYNEYVYISQSAQSDMDFLIYQAYLNLQNFLQTQQYYIDYGY